MSSTMSLPAGQYLPGNSAIHRLDPRLKLTAMLACAVALFASERWPALLVIAAGIAAALVAARVGPGYIWRGLRPLLVLLVFTYVVQLFTYPGDPLWNWGPFTVTREGLDRGGFLTARLALLLLAGIVLTTTTAPVTLTDGIEWFLRPLRRLGVPAHEIAMMMTIALRFIPTFLRELEELVRAQRARGVIFRARDPVKLAEAFLPLLVPLFVLSFRRADDLALAMTSRCYRGGEGRTRYRVMRFTPLDAAISLLLVLWLALSLVLDGRLL